MALTNGSLLINTFQMVKILPAYWDKAGMGQFLNMKIATHRHPPK